MKQLAYRAFDVTFALLALILFAPLWLIISIAIVVESPGPVFFRPVRLGQKGRLFQLWKFRTMTGVARGGGFSGQKPRETQMGALLRTLKLDEVPQLLNVLMGQMTVIGPRPENPAFVEDLGERHHNVLEVKPGITGTAALTFFDEEQLLLGAADRASAYRKDVLPLKIVSDAEYAQRASWRGSLLTILITGMQLMRALVQYLPASTRRAGKVVADAAIVIGATLLAHFVRLGTPQARQDLAFTLVVLGPLVAVRLAMLHWFGAYRVYWRYISVRDLTRIAVSTTASSIMFAGLLYVFNWGPSSYPRSVFFIEWSLSTLGLVAIRALVLSSRLVVSGRVTGSHGSTRVLIYGGGNAGVALAASLLAHPDGRHTIAFIDDDPLKQGALLHSIPVLGNGASLTRLVETLAIDEIIIAIPSATGEQMRRIIFECESLPCRLTTLPSMKEILAGQHRDRIRDLRVEDLLEREAAQVDMEALAVLLCGERILVTGAGGSIGSELCRQIVSFRPEALILLGHGENSVFEIQQELREDYGFETRAVIADIQDRGRLKQIFNEYRPTVVIHAAAHKHVPLMEQNPEEAIKNNVLGTLNLAQVAVEYATGRFVMVSSDKAVNPTSIMGATKRLAEMVIQAMAREAGVQTRFTAVRFGNVLGSRGSLIPVLRRQIAKGGPVTITHPDMVRYFMTIPEAVQLMLQACTMGGQAEVFVLDMGEPVKIVDLVRNLIRLSGLVPGKDIQIEYTGIRPGEKLFEEMMTSHEGSTATRHKQVFVARPTPPDPDILSAGIARLETAAVAGDRQAIRDILHSLVPSFGGSLEERADHGSRVQG